MRILFLLFAAGILIADVPAWEARVRVALPGPVLEVDLRVQPGDDDTFRIHEGCGAFIQQLQREVDGVWKDVRWLGDEGLMEGAERRGAHLRYQFRLGAAAAALRRLMVVTGEGEAFLVRPSAFLLRPRQFWPTRQARLVVELPPEWVFLSGLSSEQEATTEAMDDGPYCALGKWTVHGIASGGGTIRVAAPRAAPWEITALKAWIQRSADEVAWAFGGAPTPCSSLFLWPMRHGEGVGFGTASGLGGASVIVLLSTEVKVTELRGDWVLSHELTHLGVPTLDRAHRWMEEGLPTYLEPLLALRAARISPERFWGDLVRSLPQGQPQRGDQGLDRTPTWGRVYWGGALYFFLADLELRQRSGGRLTLLDALRGLHREGLNMAGSASLEAVLQTLDQATGTSVFSGLHRQHGGKAQPVDLAAIWARLGISMEDGEVRFQENAPWAHLRRAWIGPIR